MTIDRPIPVTELLDAADQMVAIEEQRARLGGILRATAEALHLPAAGDLDAIPAAAALAFDASKNLREQLDRATIGRQQLQEQLDDMACQRDEAVDCRNVIRRQLNIEKALVRDLHGQLAQAHNALRNLAQAYANTTTASSALTGLPDPQDGYTEDTEASVQDVIDDATKAFSAADTSSERVEVIRDLLESWYTLWPSTAVTDAHEGIAWQIASFISAAEARAGLPADDVLAPWIRRAIGDPGSIAGRRRGPSWGPGEEGYAEQAENTVAWSTRAVLAVLHHNGRPHCERCSQVIQVDDAYTPPLPGVGLWEHDGVCPPRVAEQGCNDCTVEPGERHRYRGCPGNQRAAARVEVAA